MILTSEGELIAEEFVGLKTSSDERGEYVVVRKEALIQMAKAFQEFSIEIKRVQLQFENMARVSKPRD